MAKKTFSADVDQLIQLVTHSIYSNKDIFLRELISNANDAIQKAKLKQSQDPNYLGDDTDLKIIVDIDKNKNTIKIIDNGIGMTKNEVIENIGTIAKSGTKSFLENIKKIKEKTDKNGNTDLIGQFGIGFYSAFMVGKKIELNTKSNDSDEGVLRISEGKGEYEIKKSNKKTRGTEITIYLNDENKEFADENKIRFLIKKHSNYIPVPIMMKKIEEINDKEKSNKEGVDKKNNIEYEQVNAMKSIWTRNKSEVKKEEYEKFYQEISFDMEPPLDIIHTNAEGGLLNYKSLLFIPKKQNPLFSIQGDQSKEYGPDLYVQNVLIMEKVKDLLPVWLRFVKGVVETNDLELNVSRELLQQSSIIQKLQKSLVKDILKSLTWQKKKNNDKYLEFHESFGRILKEGVHFDFENKEKIAEIIYFYSMKKNKLITLDEYIENIKINSGDNEKKGQKKYIYYLVGTSIKELNNSPYLEQFKDKDIDVLFFTDPIDEYVINALREFKGYEFISVSNQDIKIGDENEVKEKNKEIEKITNENKDFLAFIKSIIGKEKLEEVKFTNKLKDYIAIITTKSGQPSAQMQKILKSMGQSIGNIAKTLEINIKHPLVNKFLEEYKKNNKSDKVENFVKYIYEQALILEGGEIEDLSGFIKRINSLIG